MVTATKTKSRARLTGHKKHIAGCWWHWRTQSLGGSIFLQKNKPRSLLSQWH